MYIKRCTVGYKGKVADLTKLLPALIIPHSSVYMDIWEQMAKQKKQKQI